MFTIYVWLYLQNDWNLSQVHRKGTLTQDTQADNCMKSKLLITKAEKQNLWNTKCKDQAQKLNEVQSIKSKGSGTNQEQDGKSGLKSQKHTV